jgi:energy-coupling factor transport system substrate-specific component
MSSPKQSNLNEAQTTEQSVPSKAPRRPKSWLTVREMTVFSMLGAILFCSKLLMEWAPNIHFVAPLIITFTLVYRAKALVPVYVFVLLTGVYGGFNVWWVPYLYIWLPLWGITMLLPRRMPKGVAVPAYMLLGGLHGIAYGILYAPAQAFFFKMSFQMTVAWVLSGIPFDILHAVGNLAACTLVLPLTTLLQRLEKQSKNS